MELGTPKAFFSIERGPRIGSGGFSDVYRIDIYPPAPLLPAGFVGPRRPPTNKRQAALKLVNPHPSYGLESMMEAYIMKHIQHPCLNSAWDIQVERSGAIGIIQPLALGDASTLVKRRHHRLSPEVLKRWLWEIACGLAALHRRGILHGDVKAGNVLVTAPEPLPKIPAFGGEGIATYLEGTHVVLNDFSLSRLIADPEEGTQDFGRLTSYTSTHRPIEVWQGRPYSLSADIWALGCTFYELAYGLTLFPEQKTVPRNRQLEVALLAFEEWDGHQLASLSLVEGCCEPNLTKLSSSAPPPSAFGDDEFERTHRCNVPAQWDNPENQIINDLIMGMLALDPRARVTIWDVLRHEYFGTVRQELSHLLPPLEERHFVRVRYPITEAKEEILRKIREITTDPVAIEIAYSIYQRGLLATPLNPPSIQTCGLIANKLLFRGLPPRLLNPGRYLQDEMSLCLRLDFKLLAHTV